MRLALAISLVVGAIVVPASEARPEPQQKKTRCPTAHEGLRWYMGRANHWYEKMGEPRRQLQVAVAGCPRHLAALWRVKARAARRQYGHWLAEIAVERAQERRALYEKWRCIHEHEGAWNANTGNGYYGGLQMDMSFQQAYGSEFLARWGTADRWPVWAQIAAAERAYRVRGFSPWPNTARYCGLL